MAFRVTVSTLSGERREFDGLEAGSLLLSLLERVESGFEVPLREIRLCLDERPFDKSELRTPLEKLGIRDGSALEMVRVPPEADQAPVEYRVLQGTIIKKPGEDPTSSRVLKITRKVGARLRCTGRGWTGPSGGEWVELDAFAERPGWLLLEGSSFRLPGPLLERVEPGEEEPWVLTFSSPGDDERTSEICLRPQASIWEVKRQIALRYPGLRPERICVIKQRPIRGTQFLPPAWIFQDDMKLRDTPFKDGDELLYMYVGNLADDIGWEDPGEKYESDQPTPRSHGREFLWW